MVSHTGAIINFRGISHSSIIINKPSRGLCSLCSHRDWDWDCVGFSVWALSLCLFYWCHVLFQHKFYGTFYERCWPVLDTADSGGALCKGEGEGEWVGRSYISVLGLHVRTIKQRYLFRLAMSSVASATSS